jgi:hypothetical protein
MPFLISSDEGRNEESTRDNNGAIAKNAIIAMKAINSHEIAFSFLVITLILLLQRSKKFKLDNADDKNNDH